jgi:hypothetical protein
MKERSQTMSIAIFVVLVLQIITNWIDIFSQFMKRKSHISVNIVITVVQANMSYPTTYPLFMKEISLLSVIFVTSNARYQAD